MLRVLIVLEEGAALTLLENLAGADQRNVGIEIVLGANAQLNHVRLAPAAAGAVQVEEVSHDGGARCASITRHYASFGGKLSRLELHIALEGEGAEAHLSGVRCWATRPCRCHHAASIMRSATPSTQLFKHVAGGKSARRLSGQGHGGAKAPTAPTAARPPRRCCWAISAEADLKPELEIFADDVKCAHGAAVGDLDADSLFYLRARGIPENEARTLADPRLSGRSGRRRSPMTICASRCGDAVE